MSNAAKQSHPVETQATETPTLDDQTRRLVEKTIVKVNGLVADSGERYDAIANHVFETFYDGDVQKALNPNKDAPVGFTALVREADGALHLGRSQLFQAVRVGALNRRLVKTAWNGLGWTLKVELLRALGSDQSVDRVEAGATFASKQMASSREVRAWVDEQLAPQPSPAEGEEEKAMGPTFLAGRKALEVGAAIGKAADRRRWVNRFLKMGEKEQSAYRSAVKAAARNFEKLSQELDAAVDDA
ncbi:MAG: hypothetical protein RL199_1816 [Pseudomonadota bacterium]|jgi:hypothetical protein